MLEMTGVKLGVAPVAGPPVHHVTVVLIARQFGGLSMDVESREGSDARLFHHRIAVVERLLEAALDINPHFCGNARGLGCFAPEFLILVVVARALARAGVLVEATPRPGSVLVVVGVRLREVVLWIAVVGFGRPPD